MGKEPYTNPGRIVYYCNPKTAFYLGKVVTLLEKDIETIHSRVMGYLRSMSNVDGWYQVHTGDGSILKLHLINQNNRVYIHTKYSDKVNDVYVSGHLIIERRENDYLLDDTSIFIKALALSVVERTLDSASLFNIDTSKKLTIDIPLINIDTVVDIVSSWFLLFAGEAKK